MTANLIQIIRAAFATLREPRAAARQVMAQNIERQQCWEILALVAALSAILAFASMTLGNVLSPGDPRPLPAGPMMLAAMQLVVMVAVVFAMHLVGNWAGGRGGLNDAILLVSWLQFILICLQVVQIAAAVFFPVLALLLGLFGFVLIFVLLTIFISELHGFSSVAGVFFSVLVVLMVVAIAVRFFFGLFGFDIAAVV